MMSINIRKKHVAWISIIIISLALLGIAVGQYASGGSFPLIWGHPLHVTDIHDDQKLAGISHNVWFGQVDAKTSQVEDKDDEPYTLYSVTVLESLKGTLPEQVAVVQYGVDFSDGGHYRVAGDPDLLEAGQSYLFVTRTNAAGDEHTVVPVVGNLPWMWRKTRTGPRFWKAMTLTNSGSASKKPSTTRSNTIPMKDQPPDR